MPSPGRIPPGISLSPVFYALIENILLSTLRATNGKQTADRTSKCSSSCEYFPLVGLWATCTTRVQCGPVGAPAGTYRDPGRIVLDYRESSYE